MGGFWSGVGVVFGCVALTFEVFGVLELARSGLVSAVAEAGGCHADLFVVFQVLVLPFREGGLGGEGTLEEFLV